jgi:hypothetical protein
VQIQPTWSVREGKEQKWAELVEKAYQNRVVGRNKLGKAAYYNQHGVNVSEANDATALWACWTPTVVKRLADDARENIHTVLSLLQPQAETIPHVVAIALKLGANLLPGGLYEAQDLCKSQSAGQ